MKDEMDVLVFITDVTNCTRVDKMRDDAEIFFLQKDLIKELLYFNAVNDEEKGLVFMMNVIKYLARIDTSTTKYSVKGICMDTMSKVKDLNIANHMFPPKEIRNITVPIGGNDKVSEVQVSFPFVRVYRYTRSGVYQEYDIFNSAKFGINLYARRLTLNDEQHEVLQGFIDGKYDVEELEKSCTDIRSMNLYQSIKYEGGDENDAAYISTLEDYVEWNVKHGNFPKKGNTK